ncbi:MAG: hypothetical protein C4292_03940 [Nitrososphaera sp.]
MMEIMQDFASYASGFLNMDNSVSADGHGGCTIRFKDGGSMLHYSPSVGDADPAADGPAAKRGKDRVVVSFMLPTSLKTKKRGDWVELDTLTARAEGELARHFVAFIKRYGIRVAATATAAGR